MKKTSSMNIQVNSDSNIRASSKLTQIVEETVTTVLGRFSARITRVEVHLSDVDNAKTGKPDKRCVIEARPAGAPPRSASALSANVVSSVGQAARKMQRSLTTFFDRKGPAPKPAAAARAKTPAMAADPDAAPITKAAAKKAVAAKKAAVKEPKKTAIYQARRKAWPKA